MIRRKNNSRMLLTCMSSGMSLQIKSIVESFTAEGAEVSLDIRMTFQMSVEESLQVEGFAANFAT